MAARGGAKQWAMARVNAYLYLLKNGRPQNKKFVQDNDLLPAKHPKKGEFNSIIEDIIVDYLIADLLGLDDEDFEKNMMENLEDLYISVDKDLLEKEIQESKQLFLYSEDLEDLTNSKVYTLISYLFYSGEVSSREYMDKYLNTIFENQDQDNIATLIDKFEKISGIVIPRNEQDRLEIEQEKKTMKEQKLRDKAFKREEVVKKWKEMIESSKEKESEQKITTVVCKDYDLAYLLGGLFLYSYINEIKLDKVQNNTSKELTILNRLDRKANDLKEIAVELHHQGSDILEVVSAGGL